MRITYHNPVALAMLVNGEYAATGRRLWAAATLRGVELSSTDTGVMHGAALSLRVDTRGLCTPRPARHRHHEDRLMTTTEIRAYTHDGELCRCPDEGSWLRLDCSQCGQSTELRVTPLDSDRGSVQCPCGAHVVVS